MCSDKVLPPISQPDSVLEGGDAVKRAMELESNGSEDALAMHELRAAYQGGNIWCVKKKSHHRLVGDGRKKTEFGLSFGPVNQRFGKSVEKFLSVNASKAVRKDAGVPCTLMCSNYRGQCPLHMEVVNFNANVQTECHYHLKKLAEHLTCVTSKETTSCALGIRDQLKGSWYADEEKVTVSVEPGDTFRSEGTAAPNKMQDMNLDELKTAMSQLTLDSKRATRVLSSMIYSIALHPSETKLLVAAGGRAGEIVAGGMGVGAKCSVEFSVVPASAGDTHAQRWLGDANLTGRMKTSLVELKLSEGSSITLWMVALWDVLGDSDLSVQVFQPHCGPVNCLSVCEYDQTKLYSTSHDGTVRRADLDKLIFDDIYSSDPDIFRSHTTWHCQVDNNVLLVAHGTGQVGVVDLRDSKKPTRWCKCHDRSVRTVQRHPLDEKYFVTSSAVGEARVWDLRTATKPSPKPVCHLAHPKGLTSAFYSPHGSYFLTTCNDDRLRVYDVRHVSTNKPSVIASTKHNNHTGRWLSTFKARWHPQREDTFIIGSMELPKAVSCVFIWLITGFISHGTGSGSQTARFQEGLTGMARGCESRRLDLGRLDTWNLVVVERWSTLPCLLLKTISLWVRNFEATASTTQKRGGSEKTSWIPENIDHVRVALARSPRKLSGRYTIELGLTNQTIEVYGIHGQKMLRLQSSANLTTTCSACVFHPSQLLVAGANSSGKVHVFL
uniref:WD repeat-containing protein 76 n=1 Tax=Timema genevievae TaxID=629358 RepID=A0A7R9JTQ0_TIMGE|nr:unnamed protein product [Timema genevievae]